MLMGEMLMAKLHPDSPRPSGAIHLRGLSASPGIAIGAVVRWQSHELRAGEQHVSGDQRQEQSDHVDHAFTATRIELTKLRDETSAEDARDILNAHLSMLADPELLARIHQRAQTIGATGAVDDALEDQIRALTNTGSERIMGRAADLRDVRTRLLRHLGVSDGAEGNHSLTEQSVIVADDLTPSETIGLDPQYLRGFVLTGGGATAHTTIVARSLGIPAVIKVDGTDKLTAGSTVIVDGDAGEVTGDPTEAELNQARKRLEEHGAKRAAAAGERAFATLSDGTRVRLSANIGSDVEAARATTHGAGSVGLLRTELVFFAHSAHGLPNEDTQYQIYRGAVEALQGGRVTIRLLDVGGDKPLPPLTIEDANPMLGLRGIRLLLAHRDVLRTQLRAIARAASHGPVWISVPMVSTASEMTEVRAELADVYAALEREHAAHGPVKVGVMLETPAAVYLAPELAANSDFFSVGTNDLLQYLIAADRDNVNVADLLDPLHPALLRALRTTVESAHRAQITVSVCGEAASRADVRRLLVGLGVDELSMASTSLAEVADDLGHADRSTLMTLAERACAAPDADAVRAILSGAPSSGESEQAPAQAETLRIEHLDDGGFAIVVTIADPEGLHARPANTFAAAAQKFDADIAVTGNSRTANAKALLSLLSLGADEGATVRIEAHGAQAEEAVTALSERLTLRFGPTN